MSHLPAPCRSLGSHRAFKIAWLDRFKQLNPTCPLFVSAVVSACSCPRDRFHFSIFFKAIRLASAGAPLLEVPGDSLKVSMIDLACNWFPPRLLYGNLLDRWVRDSFLPKSSSICYCFPFLPSSFLLVPSVSWAQFCVYHSLAWSLSLFFFFWTEAKLTCSRMSEIVKPLWNKYPANLCWHALGLILPLWWTPNFLLSLGWDKYAKYT